eukprot:29462-Eustigmatos_ZCMA.PRE.1
MLLEVVLQKRSVVLEQHFVAVWEVRLAPVVKVSVHRKPMRDSLTQEAQAQSHTINGLNKKET